MSDESLDSPAAAPAPVSEPTASPDPANPEAPGDESPEPKTFTQEEMNRVVAAEKAKAARAAERKVRQEFEAQLAQSKPVEQPDPKQYNSALEYAEALADWKVDQRLAEQEVARHHSKVADTFAEREESARDKYSDYEQVAYSQGHRVTEVMASAIKESDIGPEVAYWLGSNPKEANRIAGLSPMSQVREIGRIEASLSAGPQAKKVSSAPEPIRPVGNRASSANYAPTDPRFKGSDSEWINARNKQLRAQG